jgi:hypothetical protein
MFCLFAIGCKAGGGNTNNTPSNTGNQSGAGNPSSPTTNASPTASPLPLPNALTGSDSWVQNATSVKGQLGQRYTYTCPANLKLYDVYCTGDVYYSGSSLCSAAIHAGVITQAKGGQITIEIKPAVSTCCTASGERNGVTPRSLIFNDQKDNGSFIFVRP